MTKQRRAHVDDLRAASRLLVEATKGVTGVVEAMHRTIASGPAVLGQPLAGPAGAITRMVYGGIRGVTELAGSGIDRALAQLAPVLGESAPGPERAAVQAVLNGVLGDYLLASGNPLAMPMDLCSGGEALELEAGALREAFPNAGSKLLILVHGSCMNDRQWTRAGHDHGAALAKDLGYTAVYVRYNSGLHISTNGRTLAEALERLTQAWPVPIEELAIVGHSMGGLVSRSACHAAEEDGRPWRRLLRTLVCIGSPHHGAPLERGGSLGSLLLGISRYSAPLEQLGRIRSAGVTDMRFGSVLDEDWDGRDRFVHAADPRRTASLPAGVACYAIAGTLSATMPPSGKLRGDGMVPVDSALGRHARPELTLTFPEKNQQIALGVGHLDLLDRAEVYATLQGWLATSPASTRP